MFVVILIVSVNVFSIPIVEMPSEIKPAKSIEGSLIGGLG